MIVESKFLVLFDVLSGEDADTDFPQDVPFASDTVRVARVVNKPCEITLIGRINDFSIGGLH